MSAVATPVADFGLSRANGEGHGGGNMQIATTRSAQEVQAAMVIAKKFPRDETSAFNRIMQSCRRKTLAEQALYAYPKGNTTVTGPSIRLAEAMAQSWGNMDFGIIELEQKGGESSVMAYAWDLETNTRQTKIFTVKHERHTRQGTKSLTDPRDIYELAANQGARRLRACILGIIPGDVIDAALDECEKTLTGGNKEPIADRLRKAIAAFAEIGVNQEMIEKRLGHKVDVSTEIELVNLRKIYKSIQDNMASVADFFDAGQQPKKESDIASRLDSLKKADSLTDSTPSPASHPTTTDATVMASDDSSSAAGESAPSGWYTLQEAYSDAARKSGVDVEVADKAMSKYLVRIGRKPQKGQTPKLSGEQVATLLAAIRQDKFDFADGSIRKE